MPAPTLPAEAPATTQARRRRRFNAGGLLGAAVLLGVLPWLLPAHRVAALASEDGPLEMLSAVLWLAMGAIALARVRPLSRTPRSKGPRSSQSSAQPSHAGRPSARGCLAPMVGA